MSASLSLLPSNELRWGRRRDPPDLRVVSVGRRGWPSVVIILLVQLNLGQALAGLLLFVLNIHLPSLVAPPTHLLGLSHPSLPGALVLGDGRRHQGGLLLPDDLPLLPTALPGQNGPRRGKHGVVPLIQNSGVQEPATAAPGTLAFREETTHSLGLQS